MIRKFDFFYGFWIVFAGFVVLTLATGTTYYGFIVLNKTIADYFHWSRAEITSAFLVYNLAMAVGSPLVGRLCEKYGPRKVIMLGAILCGVSLLAVSQTRVLWYFVILNAILGASFIFAGAVPVSMLISSWFIKRRGTMQGLAMGGLGFGGLLMGPLMGTYLVNSYGWQMTYVIVGAVVLVIMLPLALFVIRDSPLEKGLKAYGSGAVREQPAGQIVKKLQDSLNLREALGTRAFWFIAFTAAIYGASYCAILQNQVSILDWKNFTQSSAVAAVGVIGLFSTLGKFLFGYLCDHIDPKYAAAIAYALIAASLGAIAGASNMTHLWIYAVLLGLGQGGWSMGAGVHPG